MSMEVRKRILEWCGEEGINVVERSEEAKQEGSEFLFEIRLGGKIPTKMIVFLPIQLKDKLVFNSEATVDTDIQEKMKVTDERAVKEFIDDLSFTLTGRPTMFSLHRSNGVLDYVNVSTSLYLDGFNKNAFMSAVNDIHKSRILVLWMLRKRF